MQIINKVSSAGVQFFVGAHLPAQSEDPLEPPRRPQAAPVIGTLAALATPGSAGASRLLALKGANYGKWQGVSVDDLEREGYAGVHFDRLRAAQMVPQQSEAGEYKNIGCGPNSIARAAILMGRSVGDVNALYRNFHYNGVGPFRFGPDPLQMKDALEKDNAFRGIGVAATRVDHWGDFLAQLEWHVAQAKTPFMALLVFGQTSMHWLNIVALSPDRKHCVVLDTDGKLYRMPMEELHAVLQKDKTVAPALSKLNGVRFFP